jgi:hypothetical protein
MLSSQLLKPSGAAPGTYGSGSLIPVITVGVDGRITTISATAVSGGGGSGTVSSGASGALAYYPSAGTVVDDVPGATADASGNMTFAPTAATTGSPKIFTITGPAHTTLTASTEAIDVSVNLARTVQFATGALTLQRAVVIAGVTYAFVGSSTLSDAVTLDIAPAAAGTNATITRSTAYRANVTNTAHHGYWAAMASGANGDAFYNTVAGTKVFRVAQQGGETNVIIRANGDVTTSATDGFLYVSQFSAFTKPTGTPTSYAGAPMVIGKDATFGWHGLWTYVNGGWIDNSGIFTRYTSSSGTGTQAIDWGVWGAHITRQFTVGAGNVTFTFTAPAVKGTACTLIFIQDSTGGRSITWPATVKWAGGAAAPPDTGSNAKTAYTFVWDGTSYMNTAYAGGLA